MTVTRLGQVHAETGSHGEYSKTTAFTVSLESTIVRSGHYSWNCTSGAGIGVTFAETPHLRANFAVWVEIGLGGYPFVLHSNGAYSGALAMKLESSTLEVLVNGVSVYSTSVVASGFVQEAWNDIGVVYKSGASGEYAIYINGNLYYSATGNFPGQLDYLIALTRAILLDGFNRSYLDDMYVDAITIDEEVGPPSSKIFLSSLPTNQGVVQWTPVGDTPNYRCVDDPALADDDSTYVKTLVPDVQDLYIISPITVPTDYKIRAVIPTAVAKKGDTALAASLSFVVFDGLNTMIGVGKAVGISYAASWVRFPAQPDSTAWEETDYESMQFGFKATGTF